MSPWLAVGVVRWRGDGDVKDGAQRTGSHDHSGRHQRRPVAADNSKSGGRLHSRVDDCAPKEWTARCGTGLGRRCRRPHRRCRRCARPIVLRLWLQKLTCFSPNTSRSEGPDLVSKPGYSLVRKPRGNPQPNYDPCRFVSWARRSTFRRPFPIRHRRLTWPCRWCNGLAGAPGGQSRCLRDQSYQ